jgi:hypothetical protein
MAWTLGPVTCALSQYVNQLLTIYLLRLVGVLTFAT